MSIAFWTLLIAWAVLPHLVKLVLDWHKRLWRLDWMPLTEDE